MKKGHPLRQLLTTAGIIYVVWLLGLWALQGRLIYPGWLRLPEPEPELNVSGLEPWWLDTEEGPVEAWWIPGAGVSEDRPGPVMMAWHGNAAFIDDAVMHLSPYRDLGISVLLVEYRGFGRSAGVPSQEAILTDANAWRVKLLKRKDVNRHKFVFYGRSLGSGPAVHMAAEHGAAALVLEAPITSLKPFVSVYLAPAFLLRDIWDNLSIAPEIEAPAIVFHGRHDEVVPVERGAMLAKALKATFVKDPKAGHNDLPSNPEAHFERIAAFLQTAGVMRR
ncbi:MAG: alpha/beta hydrolase [Myxococcota bacterium]